MSGTILITGATGHVGFGILVNALSKGYTVIAAVRSEAKAGPIKSAKSIQPYLSKLSFVVVPDITTPGAFDKPLQGVDYIIHVASPIPDIKDLNAYIDYTGPAVKGTTNILESALKVPSIKRVAITSSTAAVAPPFEKFYEADISPEFEGTPPPEPYINSMFAYTASKVLAHKATLDFIKEHKPKYTIVSLMPSYVIGRHELATTPEKLNDGSNNMVLSPILGEQKSFDVMSALISLHDVARIHVESLTNEKITKHESFILDYDYKYGFQWDDSIKIAEKAFPEAVKSGVLPLGGHTVETPPVKYDSSKTVEVFGPLETPEKMVTELVGSYIEMASGSA